jgi:signal transduction histidine kinase
VETGELVLEQAPFPITNVVDDARLFKVTAERKGLKFIEKVEPFYDGLVLADRLRIRQVLANALSNAVKFTKDGKALPHNSPFPYQLCSSLLSPSFAGSVSLHLRQVEETDANVIVEFVVEDTGVGISKEVLPTLFVPFRRVLLFFVPFLSLSLILPSDLQTS